MSLYGVVYTSGLVALGRPASPFEVRVPRVAFRARLIYMRQVRGEVEVEVDVPCGA